MKTRCFLGFTYRRVAGYTPPEPGEKICVVLQNLESFSGTEPYEPPGWRPHFPTFPDLALAIQCKALGWEDLAHAALGRVRKRRNDYYEWNRRPRNDRDALAKMAWNHYSAQFAEAPSSERRLILDRMKRLLDDRRIINTQANRSLLGDIEKTLTAGASSAVSLEAAIESLLELGATRPRAHGRLEKFVKSNADCQQLLDAGLVAIPVLMKHLNDFRVTRLILSRDDNGYYSGYVWNARIADVAAHLLEKLAVEEFAYDFLQGEGRGRRLDRGHVAHWWKQTQARGVLPQTLEGEKPKNRDRTPLQEAAQRSDVKLVRKLMEAGAVLDFESAVSLALTEEVATMLKKKPWLAKLPRKPLHDPIWDGDGQLISLLLDHGADPNADFGFMNVGGPFTPITTAVTSNDFEITTTLLDRGADPNVGAGRNHDNLLIYAVAYREPRFVKALLESRADVHSTTSWGNGITPLHVAASMGGADWAGRVERWGQPRSTDSSQSIAIEKTELLLSAGADPNAKTEDGATPLLFAALAGNLKLCDVLMRSGAKLDLYSACALARRAEATSMLNANPVLAKSKPHPFQRSPLHFAAVGGDSGIVRRLLEIGADPNTGAPALVFQDASGFSVDSFTLGEVPLHVAATFGHAKVVRELIEAGADIEARTTGHEDHRGPTPLQLACEFRRPAVVKELLARDARVTFDNYSLLYAAIDDRRVLEVLLSTDPPFDVRGELGTDVLAAAVAEGHHETAQLMLARGARLDIFSASILGKTGVVKQLLEQDPSLAKATREDNPSHAIVLAVQRGHLDVVRLLIRSGAPLDSEELNGWSLPHQAAQNGQKEMLQLLLAEWFRPTARREDAETLLHAAAVGAQHDVVEHLLSLGVNVQAVDSSGQTPLHMIADSSYRSDLQCEQATSEQIAATARLLIQAGADVNARDNYGWTPLHGVAARGLTEAAKVLLAAGVEVNARNRHNETPLDRAVMAPDGLFAERDVKLVIELLRAHGGTR